MAPLAPPPQIRRRTAWQRAFASQAAETAADLARFAGLDEETARRELGERLRAIRGALFASPHHADALQRAGLSPFDLRSIDDLVAFPLLDRDTLRERWRELPASIDEHAVVVWSSGTTGDPVPVVKDGWDTVHMWSVLAFFVKHLRVELPPRPRVVLLCSLPGGLEYSVRLPLLGGGALHRISLARERPLERLRRAAPSILFTDPAGLHWLGARADAPPLRLILTSAQRFPWSRRAGFAAPIVNYYSTTETGPIAWECLAHADRFHVLAPDVFVESVDRELVVTRLRPGALPLLRYRTGDRGDVARDECACGWRGWTILGFTGRCACDFIAPDERAVDAWSLAWIFKHVPLRSFQLTQIDLQSFDLMIQSDSLDSPPIGLVERLTQALRLLGWTDPRVTPRLVATIDQRGDKPDPFRVGDTLRPASR